MRPLKAIVMIVCMAVGGTGTSQQADLANLGMEDVDLPSGLAVGELVPEFSGINTKGRRVQLSELLEDGPVIVLFYRGSWHEPCMEHLENIQDSLKQLRDLTLQVVAISPETPEGAAQTERISRATYHIISDPGGEMMRAFDVDFKVTTAYRQKINGEKGVNIATHNAADEAFLPVTATFIISHVQEVFWRHFDYDYGQRASVDMMIQAIQPRY